MSSVLKLRALRPAPWAVAALLAGLLAAGGAELRAQGSQTGVLSGNVTSSDGQGLPGVSVTVRSSALLEPRSTTTTANGDYIFKGLPPGAYKLSFELPGFATVEKPANVLLGSDVRENASLSAAAVQETVTVTADAPSVISQPTVGLNIKAQDYDKLARARDLTTLAELAPGLSQNGPNDDLTIAGGFSYDNSFLLDGVDIIDSIYANPLNSYIEDAIEEAQVLTSGISAEYGRFSGGAINATTKRGGNAFSGSFRTEFTNPSWTKETPLQVQQGIDLEDRTFARYQATLGGPLVKDRLWFFTAGRYRSTDDPLNFPETGIAYTPSTSDKRLELKLTGNVTPNHTLQAAYTKNDTKVLGGVNTCCPFIDPASINDQKFPVELFVGSWNGVLNSRLFGEVQYSQQKSRLEFGGTSPDIHDSPAVAVTLNGIYNAPYFDATDPAVRNNRQITGSLSYFLSTSRFGRHDLKGGYENFRSTDVGGNSQSSTSYVLYTDYLVGADGQPVVEDGAAVPTFTPFGSFLLNWRAVRGAELKITTQSFYANDKWSLGSRWSFNLGARYERVRSDATGGISSIDTDTLVPRLAATYDVRGDGKFTLNGTYAHYAGRYNPAQFGGNTNVGNPTLVYGIYTGPEGAGHAFEPGFDPNNYATVGGNFPTANVFFEPNLSSPVSKEWGLSAGAALPRGGYVRATYTHRRTSDFVEDFIDLSNGVTTVTEDGITFGTFTNRVFRNSDLPKRLYEGLQLQASYRLTDRWNLSGHYTLQLKNDGTFEGEAPGQPGISSGLGNFPELSVPERNFPDGHLSIFQRHRIRAWTTYDVGLGKAGKLDLGLLWRYDSALSYSLAATGVPYSDVQVSRDPGYPDPPQTQTLYFGQRGSQSFNGTHRFDLAVNYELPLYRSLRPWFKAELRNMFNNQALIGFDTTIVPQYGGALDADGLPTTYTNGPRFGQGTSNRDYPVPRTFQFALGFRF